MKKEITDEDVRRALNEAASEVIREQREEILRRARRKLEAAAEKEA